jgi:nicotinamidase-related amidase
MRKNSNLHGSAPDEHPIALLIIDLISDFRFPDGEKLARAARRIAPPIARLSKRARASGVPIIYVNDNRGRWRSDRTEMLERCSAPGSLGKAVVEELAPENVDYFIFKPKHSGFFATPLAALLEHLGARTLILTGVTTEQCILFTAIDAYVREYELSVPRDCVAGVRLAKPALTHMERVLKANTPSSTRVRFTQSGRRGNQSRAS